MIPGIVNVKTGNHNITFLIFSVKRLYFRYLGKTCDVSICDNNPCLFGGTCIPFVNTGYICLCSYGKHGHFCENGIYLTSKFNYLYFINEVNVQEILKSSYNIFRFDHSLWNY